MEESHEIAIYDARQKHEQELAFESTEKLFDIIKELEKLYRAYNDKYYEGKLPAATLTVQTNGHKPRRMGWFMADCWKDEVTGRYSCEIAMCPEFFYREPLDICDTLLHEMVHLYCYTQTPRIKETSRHNDYHNKRFKEVAITHGLNCARDKTIGWTTIGLTEEAAEIAKNTIRLDVFAITRLRHVILELGGGEDDEGEEVIRPPKKATRRKKIEQKCPMCGFSIKTKTNHPLICGKCQVALEQNDPNTDIGDEELEEGTAAE